MSTDESPWMSSEDLARYLSVPIKTIEAWRYGKRGPIGHRVGKHVRYHRDEVDAWVMATP